MLAGFLLVLGGGLIALSSRQDWLTAHLSGSESATLNVANSRFSVAILICAAVIILLGFFRVSRGLSKDVTLHQVAALASFAVVVAAFVRTAVFLDEKNLAVGSLSSWTHLDLARGIYMLAGGVAVTLASRLA